jgi:hypothetical protein
VVDDFRKPAGGVGAAGCAALVEQPERFQSRKLLGECRSFVRLPNGATGARAGTHDDRVMAMAIGLGARAEISGQRSELADEGGQRAGIRRCGLAEP